jgi:hypothetical protein
VARLVPDSAVGKRQRWRWEPDGPASIPGRYRPPADQGVRTPSPRRPRAFRAGRTPRDRHIRLPQVPPGQLRECMEKHRGVADPEHETVAVGLYRVAGIEAKDPAARTCRPLAPSPLGCSPRDPGHPEEPPVRATAPLTPPLRSTRTCGHLVSCRVIERAPVAASRKPEALLGWRKRCGSPGRLTVCAMCRGAFSVV